MKFTARVYVYTTVDQTVEANSESEAFDQAADMVAEFAAQGAYDRDLTIEAQEIINE